MVAAFSKYKRYLFARAPSGIVIPGYGAHAVFVSVDAKSKDEAIARLAVYYPSIPSLSWDFLDELDPDTDSLGRLGQHIPFKEYH